MHKKRINLQGFCRWLSTEVYMSTKYVSGQNTYTEVCAIYCCNQLLFCFVKFSQQELLSFFILQTQNRFQKWCSQQSWFWRPRLYSSWQPLKATCAWPLGDDRGGSAPYIRGGGMELLLKLPGIIRYLQDGTNSRKWSRFLSLICPFCLFGYGP